MLDYRVIAINFELEYLKYLFDNIMSFVLLIIIFIEFLELVLRYCPIAISFLLSVAIINGRVSGSSVYKMPKFFH